MDNPIAGILFNTLNLLRWSIIAKPPGCPKGRQAAWLHQFHLYTAIFAISVPIGGSVAENVLVAKLEADFGGYVWQLVQVLHRKLPSPRLFRDFGQQTRSRQLFRRAPAGGDWLENSDRIDLDVGFAHAVLYFAFRVTAAVVAAVGNNEQGFTCVPGLFHGVQGQVNGVEQSR